MPSEEDHWKRDEDREWRKKVDHEQVTLMTGHQVLQGKLDDLEDEIGDVDKILRGDPENERSGLIARLERVEDVVSRLNSVVFMDAAGERGMYATFKRMKAGRDTEKYRWQFWTAVIVAILSLVGLIIKSSGPLESFWRRWALPDTVGTPSKSSLKKRRTGTRKRLVPKEDEPDERSQNDVPERRGDDGGDLE